MECSLLPVASFLPEIRLRLREKGALILHAAPGAGKTTLVPGAVAEEFPEGTVALLEPRRITAVAAAARLNAISARSGFAGFQVRGESKLPPHASVIAMTPGILLRQLQNDPELTRYSAVIFDEFHERSCECDLLLALILEMRKVFRPDLKLVIMSATLDGGALKGLLEESAELHVPGREYPVQIAWSEHGCTVFDIPERAAKAAAQLFGETGGDLLVFLPGAGEIARTHELLEPLLGRYAVLMELHGGLALDAQSKVLKKLPPGQRKVILATNIAESSLTVDGVTGVIDCGFERKPEFQAGSGLTFLNTMRISKASADQRSGRAGRTAPGTAWRLWSSQEQAGLAPFTPPEILNCDLCRTALELAIWGADPKELSWLDAPPEGAFAAARELLRDLGALDRENRPTARGRKLAALPLHPRIGTLLLKGEELGMVEEAIDIAAVLESGESRMLRESADLQMRIEAWKRDPAKYRSIELIAAQLRKSYGSSGRASGRGGYGVLIAAAYPERVAKARSADGLSWILREGRGASLKESDPLRRSPFLAVADLGGKSGGDGVIRLAAPLTFEEVEKHFGSDFTERTVCRFDTGKGRASGVRERVLGAIVLSSAPCDPGPGERARAVLQAAVERGIPLVPETQKEPYALLKRLRFASRKEPDRFGNWEEAALAEKALPFLGQLNDFAALGRMEWSNILRNIAGFQMMSELDRLYPESFRTPAGALHRIDYASDVPTLSVRLQEMLGVKVHPAAGAQKIPLKIELLSPAQRVIQVTSDLPGFWHGSYALVRKEMKAAYPKHEWPEDPAEAAPMLRSVRKKG